MGVPSFMIMYTAYQISVHKPLESILRKPFHQAPARLQQMIMSIQKYPITVEYKAGTQLFIADTLSRAPLL